MSRLYLQMYEEKRINTKNRDNKRMQTHNTDKKNNRKINMETKLTENKKELLRKFVDNKCEQCNTETKLIAHRINRGYMGGQYILRNIKMLCSKCHKAYNQ